MVPKDFKERMNICDLIATIVAEQTMKTPANDEIIKESFDLHSEVSLNGISRGTLLYDWYGFTQKTPNVKLVTQVNNEILKNCVQQNFSSK